MKSLSGFKSIVKQLRRRHRIISSVAAKVLFLTGSFVKFSWVIYTGSFLLFVIKEILILKSLCQKLGDLTTYKESNYGVISHQQKDTL